MVPSADAGFASLNVALQEHALPRGVRAGNWLTIKRAGTPPGAPGDDYYNLVSHHFEHLEASGLHANIRHALQ
ncbi:MAG TPA: hypothetical protein VNW97_08575 [Candidatus Saccharimonadales bacterium]|nr:hypothetical protein [Candidatus Saccharimonadales bacterium]